MNTTFQFIGQFLKENGLLKTLESLESELGKPIRGEIPQNAGSLQEILADRLQYLHIKETKSEQQNSVIFPPWPSTATVELKVVPEMKDMIVDCAILTGSKYAVFSTAKKEVLLVDLTTLRILSRHKNGVVVKRIVAVDGENRAVLIGMDGGAVLGRFKDMKFVEEYKWKLHSRLVTEAVAIYNEGKTYVVSCGWDKFIRVHEIKEDEAVESISGVEISSNICCMDACFYKGKLVVVVGKTDISVVDVFEGDLTEKKVRKCPSIALNDAEFSTFAFYPRCLKINSGNEPILAVSTSQEPQLRLLMVQLKEAIEEQIPKQLVRNQVSTSINTLAPLDKYSLGKINWRADGRGVWVFGDDGILRGIDLATGNVCLEEKGHEGPIKCYGGDHDLVTCGGGKVITWTTK